MSEMRIDFLGKRIHNPFFKILLIILGLILLVIFVVCFFGIILACVVILLPIILLLHIILRLMGRNGIFCNKGIYYFNKESFKRR
jgi:lysylphosphatidylglycerol synthetase-like protein (DUF2156 family)